MNKKALELGLKNTNFVTPHGLDNESHYTTALELAKITDYALNIDIFKEIVKTKNYTVIINGYPKNISNTNELLGYLNGVNGVKTGFTNGAGRCLVTSIERDGLNIITVVLGADTKKIRTKDSINLIEYIYSNYEIVNLENLIKEEYNKWLEINKNRIEIYKGKKVKVSVKLDDYKYKIYPVKKEEIKDIIVKTQNTKLCFEAPLWQNQEVALLKVCIGNEQLMNIKILTNEDVERKTIKDYFVELIMKVGKGI